MSRSASAPRRLAAAWVLAAGAGLAAVPAAALAAEDDFEFADGLSRRGYSDLAAEVYNSLLTDPKASRERKAEGQYGLATLAYNDARFHASIRNEKTRKPMADVLEAFDDADKVFEKFISENASHARVLEAKLTRAKLLQDKAEFVNGCIAEGRLPAGTTDEVWRKQVADWFDVAIQLLDANLSKAKDLKSKSRPETPEYEDANDQLTLLWLYRILALYGKGAALPKGDPAGEASLKQAIKEGTDDFQWEAGSNVRGLWAMHYSGLAAWRLGDVKAAYSHLRGGWAPHEGATPPMQDVTFQSYREVGRLCLESGNRDGTDWIREGLKVFDDFAKKWPDHLKHPEGQRAALAGARLYERAGQTDRAMEVVQKTVKAAETTYARAEAVKFLGDLLSKAGPLGGGDPKQLMNVAQVKLREEDYRGAIRGYQGAIVACSTPDDWANYGWKAWELLGRAYYSQGRFWESYLAMDVIEQAWRKDKNDEVLSEITKVTAYARAAALDSLARQTKDPADAELAKRATAEFAADHPDSPHALVGKEKDAENKLQEALQLRDVPESYKAKLREALAAFQGIDATSKSHDSATAKVADIHRKLGEHEKAVELADAWLAAKRADTRESTVVSARLKGRQYALVVAIGARADRAAALDKSRDPKSKEAYQSLLDALAKHEKDFVEAVSGGQGRIDEYRAEALIGTGQVDKADEMIGKLIEASPNAPNNVYLSARVAAALEREAGVWRGKGDEPRYQAYMLRAARRREWTLDRLKVRTADAVRSVAKLYAEGHDFGKAEVLFKEAQQLYEAARDAATAAEEKKRADGLVRACRVDLTDLLVLQEKYDKAIPELEAQMVLDPKVRATVVARLQKDDNIPERNERDPSAVTYASLIAQVDSTRELLDSLSRAYMKAPSKERLFGAVNLCQMLELATKPDERHQKPWIDVVLRRAEAYLALAGYTKTPEHWKAARDVIQNRIVIPGLLDSYEQDLPGSKRRAEDILKRATAGLGAAGGK